MSCRKLFILLLFAICINGCENPLESKKVVDNGFLENSNENPTISAITNQSTLSNTPITGISFSINDNEQVLGCTSSILMTSSNTALIDSTDVTFSGVAPNCFATLSPNTGQFGSSTIDFILSDGTNTSSSSFVLDVDYSPVIEANIAVWLDGKDSDTKFQDSTCSTTPAVIFGDSVGCWINKVATMNSAVQAGVNQPTLGNNGVVFDGVDDVLSIAGKSYDEDSDLSIFVAIEVDSQSTDSGSCCRPFVSFVTTSAGLFPWVGLTRPTFSPGDNLFHGFASGAGIGYVVTAAGDPIITSALHDGTNKLWSVYSQGVSRVTNHAIPGSYTTTTTLDIGGDSGNTARRIAGEINEVIVTEGVLTVTEVERIEGYLACKYDYRDSLDSSHPFYDTSGSEDTGCL